MGRQRRHLGHQHVEVRLDGDESVVELRAVDRLGPGDAEGGLRLVDHPVQLDPRRRLRRPAAVEEAGRPVVALRV